MVIKKKRVLIPLHKRFDFSSFKKPICPNWIASALFLGGFCSVSLELWLALFLVLWWWVCRTKVGEGKWGVGHF